MACFRAKCPVNSRDCPAGMVMVLAGALWLIGANLTLSRTHEQTPFTP